MKNFETQLLLNLNELEFDTSEELTPEAIKSHYKKLSLYYHPDVNHNEIFHDKQKKINAAKEFLLENLDEINRYIRRINHKETDEDKARAQKEQWERDEQARKAYYEQEARKKQAEAEKRQAEAEKRQAEAEKRQAEAEKRQAQQKTENAKREAAEANARAAEAEAKVKEAERIKAEKAKKNRTIGIIAVVAVFVFLIIPFLIGCIIAGVNGFNEGMKNDKESAAAADKEAKTMQIIDTNLPKSIVAGIDINWADYYVTYKDKDGKEQKVTLSENMVTVDYEKFEEQSVEINVGNGSAYLYHKLTVIDSTVISNAEDLKAIASKPDGIYILNADIDLGSAEWTPIANFKGQLIGNGHTVKNLTITSFSTKNVGLFEAIEASATVSDIKFENVSIVSSSSAESVGAVAGLLEGTVKNITVSGKIECSGSNAVGGIIGSTAYIDDTVKGTITNCSFDGSVIGNEGVGGILGGKNNGSHATIENCTVNGSVSGISGVGGIAGMLDTTRSAMTHNITNCKNNAKVTATLKYCGGIVGKLHNISAWGTPKCSVTGNQNNGEITGGEYTGGIVGCMEISNGNSTATVNNNVNKATVTGKNYTGGIIGYNDFDTEMTSSQNSGTIHGEAYVGGFVGFGNLTNISGVTNEGTVSGHYYVGGIIGYGKNCVNCQNNGNISATLYDTEKKTTGLGGIGGLLNEADGCTNTGAINSRFGYDVGGIIGANASDYYDSKATNCKNSGKVTANGDSFCVGGIVGSFFNSKNVTVSGCENTGAVAAQSGSGIGGIIGYCYAKKQFTVLSCTSTGGITANNCEAVGGIVGKNTTKETFSISVVTVSGSITGIKTSSGSVIGHSSIEPENYSSVKSTYRIEQGVNLPYIGSVGEA